MIIILLVVIVAAVVFDFAWLTLHGKGPMQEGIFGRMLSEGLPPTDWNMVTGGLVTVLVGWLYSLYITVYKFISNSIAWMIDFHTASRNGTLTEM
jgi:hypothetical protein